jgi:hypothetical protein
MLVLVDQQNSPKSLWGMPQRDYWWCIIVAKYGAFLFTEIGAFVITDYNKIKVGLMIRTQSHIN